MFIFSENLKVIYKKEKGSKEHAYSITVFGDYLYWTDWTQKAILRMEKKNNGTQKPIKFRESLEHVRDVHVYDQARQQGKSH